MIRWFAGHPTAANLLLLVFIAAGIFAAPTLLRETFPDFRPTEAEVSVTYRGAAALDVESAICAPLWDAVQGVEALDSFTCTAQDNLARAVATMEPAGDALRFLNALRTEVAAIDTFPERADPATVRELHRTDLVTSVAVSGAAPLRDLDRYAEQLGDRLAALEDVAQVNRSGLGTRTLSVLPDHARLSQHGLGAAALAAAIGAQSLDLPGGLLETPGTDLTLRFTAEARDVTALAALPVMTLPDGAVLRLGDLADIRETFEPAEQAAFVNGAPAILLEVHKPLDADALRALDDVQRVVDAEAAALPPGIHVEVVQDVTSIIRDRLAMLVQNGILGLVLVIAVMSLFFRPGFAIWAAMGLPVAFLGAFVWMALTGLSLNMMTLVALLMAIGIVMDDSIVLSDSIAVHAAKGISVDTVTAGVMAVAPGVLSSFLTTVSVFLPLSFLSGELGAVLEVLPLVLLAALAASLIEAFLILPHHLKGGLRSLSKPPSRFRQRFETGFDHLRETVVGRAADIAIARRWLVAGLAIGALILTVGALRGGVVKREAMPEIDGDVLEARLLLPAGTPLARTEQAVRSVEEALDRVNARLAPTQPEGQDLVLRTITRMGRNASAGESGAHVATVSADLLSAETRTTTLDTLIADWRAEAGLLPGVSSLILTEPGIGPQGIAIELRLSHPDLTTLERAGHEALSVLGRYEGVRNAMLDLRAGKPELRLTLAAGAHTLGLTAADVAGQLRAAYLGTQLADVRQGDLPFDVLVQLRESDRDARADLDDFMVALGDGTAVPLGTVVEIKEARGWSSINRRDGLRSLTVQADVDGRLGNADAITARMGAEILPLLATRYPGLSFEIAGQAANSAETVGSILRGFLVGIVGIYLVLSFQFRSYVEPVIVMLTIPLAFLGVIWGHAAMGYNISMPSLVGAASLAGIVVNNAILLVEVINATLAEGATVAEAAGRAVRARFRPIFVSVSTTILGMAPLLAESSTQAQTLKPLVISVVFGLLASTVLVLLVLPALYAILAELGLTRHRKAKE
ncbi:efflux RND transporter permease subunit [Pseudothioclava nitratireducens]|uniref:efflux RND transporter permease subunit n=1 Tax=Pseudothioclava nitratireducens TaxID=1928646 RepID=UPI0023DCBE97|nr:efflux RND transporter permease subunit [Defluviimonas nitratireducens]MDF1619263.1 efflux RND transporter permease subunit [Defluviimonas nitratireducens]